jgi:hypothetical protein
MLNKSDLLSLLQCPRKLWLQTHRPDLQPEPDAAAGRRLADGVIVGEKAREQLGRDYLWPAAADDKVAAAAEAHRLLLAAPEKAAAEVPFARDGLYVRADALLPSNGGYVLRETKCSTFPLKRDRITPDAPDEQHLIDVAIQTWAATGSGLAIVGVELNLLDSQWRYHGDGNDTGLFRQLDVSEAIQPLLPQVPVWLQQARDTLDGPMPNAATGKQCGSPNPCPYRAYCFSLEPPGPEHPIELLPDAAGKALARKLKASKGYLSLLDPAPQELQGKAAELYRRMQQAHRTGKAIVVPGARALLDALPYPRYYFDFEGIDLPVPLWKGVRPFEQVTFQWSCHVERAPRIFEHAEFLDLSGADPSLACIRHMAEAIDPDDVGPIFVYSQSYEKGRMEELARRHPEHAPLLLGYIERLVDLLPLVKEHFYDPRMRGSFSIKKVLPVIAPDLDYRQLTEVQDGTGAQMAYLTAALDRATSPARKAELEQRLRIYCRRDTWSMVKVAYFLADASDPTEYNYGSGEGCGD